ncbi:hypothetical protein RFI_10725 [Reticulomyxa filosa]|uniref:Uncharacterized protein n=1 Tax=Reticulomyxa filosa TaxID=46433 RepID=X6NL42_RETFI|nr:hypothetical protein RFI_10725 [Reticulomyxa filosa]|eukprot:ETO26414.1 hypothetical protein RFI_10725 [Reticulomyxa filosa]
MPFLKKILALAPQKRQTGLTALSQKALDFKKRWDSDWIKANVQAATMVEQMMKSDDHGLIVVAKNGLQLQNTIRPNVVQANTDVSFLTLVNNEKAEKKKFGEYWLFVIKSNMIILDEVTIDGNVYAIDCETECQKGVNITTQFFIAKHAIVNQRLSQCISTIQWNTRLHHDIPVQIQILQDKAEQCSEIQEFDDAIAHLQIALRLSTETFGPNHPYVADSYHKIDYDKAISFYKKSLQIRLDIFGNNHVDVANSYYNLGLAYDEKGEYEEATECHEKELEINKNTFGNISKAVADSNANLALILEKRGESEAACKIYEKTWKIFSVVLGEWHEETMYAKQKVEILSILILSKN